MTDATRIKELETELASLRAPLPEPTDGMDVIAALKYHYSPGWGSHQFSVPGFLLDQAVAEIERLRAAKPTGDRAKLIEEIRWFVKSGHEINFCVSRAAAQIEADGARETALLDISARFAEMTARAIKAEAEIERLNAIIHGMQDGALVRDQTALIGRLEAENADLRDQIEQGQAGRVAMTERAWQQDRRIKALEAENERLKTALEEAAQRLEVRGHRLGAELARAAIAGQDRG